MHQLRSYKFCPQAVDVSVRGSKPGKNVQLLDTEIRSLCMKSREIFLNQPVLLELEAPLKICGMCVVELLFFN